MDLRGRFELGDDGAYFNSRATIKLTEDRDARQNDKDPSARAAGAGWRDNLDPNESGAEAGCRLLAADSEGLGRGRSPLLVAAAGRAGSAAGLYLRRILLPDAGADDLPLVSRLCSRQGTARLYGVAQAAGAGSFLRPGETQNGS